MREYSLMRFIVYFIALKRESYCIYLESVSVNGVKYLYLVPK